MITIICFMLKVIISVVLIIITAFGSARPVRALGVQKVGTLWV